jgi:hypothetical protein
MGAAVVARAYLSSLLKRVTGEKHTTLVTRLRMDEAKRLLRDPRLRINEVAGLGGYSDYLYFYHVFKRRTGVSAKQYRNHSSSKIQKRVFLLNFTYNFCLFYLFRPLMRERIIAEYHLPRRFLNTQNDVHYIGRARVGCAPGNSSRQLGN